MRVIGIVSGKGGVGKTTVAVNLGVALAQMKKDVTLVDCNITTSHLGFYFGLQYYPITLNHVLRGEVSPSDAIYTHPSGLNIIPASLSLEDLVGVEINDLNAYIKNLDSEFVLLDSAPGFGREALSVLRSCDEVLFVTIPFMNAVSDVYKCSKILSKLNVKPLGIVLNMVRNKDYELRKEEVEAITDLEVISVIPFDPAIQISLSRSMPPLLYNPYSKSSLKFFELASFLTGEKYPIKKPKLFSRFYRFFWNFFAKK